MTERSIAVVATSNTHERAAALAAKLELPLVSSLPSLPVGCSIYLSFCDDRLQLFPADAKQSGPVCVDFASNATAYRLQSGGELIVKAVKGRSKEPLKVIDATAGLGRDSFVLAAHGFQVDLFERNTVIAALLDDGLERARQSANRDIVARMRLHSADVRHRLSDLVQTQAADVIYLDPMFAHVEKAAQVKKEMRLFRQLLGEEHADAAALLTFARKHARLRVVVKRALKAEYFAAAVPAYSVSGKAIRFDVYPS